MNDPLGSLKEGVNEAIEEYKKMSKILLVFCGLAAIGIVVVSIAIFRQSK